MQVFSRFRSSIACALKRHTRSFDGGLRLLIKLAQRAWNFPLRLLHKRGRNLGEFFHPLSLFLYIYTFSTAFQVARNIFLLHKPSIPGYWVRDFSTDKIECICRFRRTCGRCRHVVEWRSPRCKAVYVHVCRGIKRERKKKYKQGETQLSRGHNNNSERKRELKKKNTLPRTDEWVLRFWSGISGREPPTLWNNSAGKTTTTKSESNICIQSHIFLQI